MIDPADRQTQALPLDEPKPAKRRGRPSTGQALSNAERQRRYRENLKAQRNEKMHQGVAEDLRAELANALERAEKAEEKLRVEFELGEKARSRAEELSLKVAQLEHQLKQRNEKPARAKRHRDQPAAELPDDDVPDIGVWTVRFKTKGSRAWVNCDAQIDFEGKPWGYEETRKHVIGMAKRMPEHTWQMVRNDGLIYDPKAAK